jgi:opacity protein-like surface antigen
MAGFSYKVWDNTKLDLGYRFLHLQGFTVTGVGAPENIKVPNQNIHELRAGVRFDIN